MVVDDAIVVLENITKHIERGSKPRDAAIYATNEVLSAVIASTMTIVAVFPIHHDGWHGRYYVWANGLDGNYYYGSLYRCRHYPHSHDECTYMLRLETKNTKFFKAVYTPIARMLDSLDKGL